MRQAYGGPKLPVELRNQFDQAYAKRTTGARNGPLNRKDRRKAERDEKKRLNKQARRPIPVRPQNGRGSFKQQQHSNEGDHGEEEEEEEEEEIDWDNISEDATPPPPLVNREPVKPHKSILKKSLPLPEKASPPPNTRVSLAVKEKLAEDDAEIAALEKRLGVKGKKKSKAKDIDDYGLSDIFGDLGDFSSEEDQPGKPNSKRKLDEDTDWLASKRRKALRNTQSNDSEESGLEDSVDSESGDTASVAISRSADNSDASDSDLGDFNELDDIEEQDPEEEESTEEEGGMAVQQKPLTRENPYVAPVTNNTTQSTKYVPPALRAPPSSDAEALSRLRRQIQGLFNRLSEANILTILRDIEAIYQNNPRGYVNDALVDLLIGMLSDPSALLDTFLNLHAGFIAAIYKVIGPDFGAQLIERIVLEFDRHYESNKTGSGKQVNNLMSVIAELYTFQVIGSNIVFDYIRFLLEELSEINTELLLRIVRAAGSQLRQDDPTSLKDIVILLQKSVAKVGQANLPVRTKFMIETINDLKNNKMKTGIAATAVSREHTIRMKKQLGTLNTRHLKATEPLRVGLNDIRDTEKKGKWWLVGASWRNDPGMNEPFEQISIQNQQKQDIELDGDNSDVDLIQLARENRMNTDIRRAIFISIMSASDFKDAQIRLSKLNLKKSQETEIPRVLVHCAGAEKSYNPFYSVLARKICSDHKMRKSFQFALWDIFRSLGEKQDATDDSDEEPEPGDSTPLRKLVNQGKMYGTLIGKRALPITSLKNLNFPYLQPKTKTFVEVVLVTAILESLKSSKDKRNERAVREVFVEVDQAPEMIAGLQFFLKKVVKKTKIVEQEETETVAWACKSIIEMFTRVLATTTMHED